MRILLVLLALSLPAAADVVFLKGGQRLEGELQPKGSGYEIKTGHGTWTLPKEDILKIVKSPETLTAEAETLHAQARAIFKEALAIENDPKAVNAKLRAALELLRKVADISNEGAETYTDEKHAYFSEDLVKLLQEMRLYRDKMASEVAGNPSPAPAPPPEPPPAEPAPAPAEPAPAPAPFKPPVRNFDVTSFLARANAGDPDAQVELGMYYEDSAGKVKAALQWYTAAAAKDHVRAACRLGRLYGVGGCVKQNYKEAQKWLAKAESKGSALARVYQGMMIFEGRGVPKDIKKADAACEKAARAIEADAKAGDVESLCALGWMHLEGMGIYPSRHEAVKCIRKAAEEGYPPAMNFLGVLYRDGRRIGKDREEALRWFGWAAEQGYGEALVNLGEMYDEFPGQKNEHKDRKKAREEYAKAVAQGHGRGLFRLGGLYLIGEEGLSENPAEALRLFQEALKVAGDDTLKHLHYYLGTMYHMGKGVKKDPKEAMKWYTSAAEMGNVPAQSNLGVLYADNRNDKEALRWFQMAAKQGLAAAQNNMGTFHAMGRGVRKNLDEAERWFLMAAQQGSQDAIENLQRLRRE